MLRTALHWSHETFTPDSGEVIVLVDTLRASSVIPVALHAGAERVLAVREASTARTLKQEMSDTILAGERSGRTLEGFDCGNSPPYMLEHAAGKTVVLTTGNFCRVIGSVASRQVPVIAAGAVNAHEAAAWIVDEGFEGVHFVATGTYHFRGEELEEPMETREDSIAARRIAYELDTMAETDGEAIGDYRDIVADDERLVDVLWETEYAQYLLELDTRQGGAANREDMEVCFAVNDYPVVPVLDRRDQYTFTRARQHP